MNVPRATPPAAVVALVAACVATIATAGVSVLATDANDLYGPAAHRPIRGKRAVPAALPAPDACFVRESPSTGDLTERAVAGVAPILRSLIVRPLLRGRPLHEIAEVPVSFVEQPV